jgi:hypothetical protein
MGRSKNHIDEQFRKQLRRFEASPPEDIWNGISSSLSQDRRKHRMVVFWRMAASVAVLLCTGTVFFLLRQEPVTPLTDSEQAVDPLQQPSPQDRMDPLMGEGIQPRIEERMQPSMEDRIAEGLETGTIKAEPELTMAAADRETVISSENILIEDKAIPFLAETPSLQHIRSYSAGPLEHTIPGAQLTRMQAYTVPQTKDKDGGIDLFEQWGEDGKNAFNRWAVGTQITPLYSYRSVGSTSESVPSESYFNQVENGMLAYAGGVNVNYSPRKRFALQTGLYYSKMGLVVDNALQAKGEGIYTASKGTSLIAVAISSGTIRTDPESGGSQLFSEHNQADGTSLDISELRNNNIFPITGGEVLQYFEFLELPVIMRYRLVDRKVGFNLLGGVSTNLLVGRDAYFRQDGSQEFLGITDDLKTVNYSSIIGVGFDYEISSSWNLNFEPTFRYYLNSINAFSGLKSHPYSFGFYTGLSYSF